MFSQKRWTSLKESSISPLVPSRNYTELGQAPYNEDCVQPGDANYRTNAIRECQTYIQAIRNYLGPEPDGALLTYKRLPEGAGTHYEVVCYYDREIPGSMEYAFMCEAKGPATWEDGSVKPPSRQQAVERVR